MSEKIGCMNCGNISCKNNKKRESNGCGRWKTPEQRILELEEKVGMAERTRDRLISIGFPTFASCKEYAAKLKELEKENAQMKEANETLATMNNSMWVELEKKRAESQGITNKLHQLIKAKEIIKTFCGFCSVFNSTNGSFDNLIAEAEQFLSEVEK